MIKYNTAAIKVIASTNEQDYTTLVDKITTEASHKTRLSKVPHYCLQAIDDHGKIMGGGSLVMSFMDLFTLMFYGLI